MKILGIETSCDETAAAIVEDGTRILSSEVASQSDIHEAFGGVVPEVAARSHIEVMLPTVKQALAAARVGWDEIDAIAVTQGPGLIGSLLIGTLTAGTLAALKHKPLIPVNHIQAHTYAGFLLPTPPSFPLLSLTASGSHTQLVLFRGHGDYLVLGKTLDDACGEAFDKVAKMIGLSYPGGPEIELAAKVGNSNVFTFPKPKLGKDSLDFSFSGLKTAVLRAAQTAVGRDFRTPSHEIPALLSAGQRNDIAASFQKTTVTILCDRLLQAYERHSPASVIMAGGVAANQALRAEITKRLPVGVIYPPLNLCTDNAAMIASLGFFQYKNGRGQSPLPIAPNPILSM
ncbi:MAG TPA: tRNA (adenosine(37)-N6)-threonylcarbamoyltransferase complex transferase subunit TsaD [Candidatus Polarisedimenticolaceae bacterium]|nr:tRNA (adenosine(37)-N6)-threonylcarbamoyltransferase complex transferase subunit TsaD [Candidatus Polarisedimenticolaceae bacterium]